MAPIRTRAHDFFDTHVVPSVEEWRNNLTDIRLAMNAAVALNPAVALNQMADHFWHAYATVDPNRVFGTSNTGAFRKELGVRHPHFALVRDVAEAHKHVKLDRPGRTVTTAKQTSVGATGWGEAGFDTGPWGGGPSVVIELDDGSKQHLTATVTQVEQLWTSLLH